MLSQEEVLPSCEDKTTELEQQAIERVRFESIQRRTSTLSDEGVMKFNRGNQDNLERKCSQNLDWL